MKTSQISTKAARWILILLPLCVACFQFYFSQRSTLNRWKGGGFGMYSAPHPDHRAIWIEIIKDSLSEKIKIFPIPNTKQKDIGKAFQIIEPLIWPVIVFPSSVNYSQTEFKNLRHHLEEKNGKPIQLKLLVTELHWNLDQRQFSQTLLFQHEF